jgi:hypothetical protein
VLRAAEEREGESLEGRETTRGGRAPPSNPNPEAAGGADRLRSSDVSPPPPPPSPHPLQSPIANSPSPPTRARAFRFWAMWGVTGVRSAGVSVRAAPRACCSPAFTGGAGGLLIGLCCGARGVLV